MCSAVNLSSVILELDPVHLVMIYAFLQSLPAHFLRFRGRMHLDTLGWLVGIENFPEGFRCKYLMFRTIRYEGFGEILRGRVFSRLN